MRGSRTIGLAVLLAFVLVLPAFALSFPPLTGRVVDDANILSANTRAALTQRLAAYEQSTSNHVVVATVSSLQGTAIADYGYQLGRAWGIGQKGKNNGVILLVAPNQRKVRIEVGYGLEGTLTDALSKLIIENEILPAFRNGNYDAGVTAGVSSILQVLGGEGAKIEKRLASSAGHHGSSVGTIAMILIQLVIWGGVLWVVFGRGGRGGRGGRRRGPIVFYPGGFGGGGWGRGSGGGGDGFSGGGFSGGGGSFGGGGASGGW